MPDDNQALLLQVSADVRRLEKQMARGEAAVDKSSRAMERRAQQASTNLERFFGKTDPAKALDKVFDATRFKVLDTGVAKIGLMGGALESLGPAGLAAAAAVGALGAAFAGAREAAKFADDINDTAARLHVTTDALQEYRYAIRAAGGEEKGADEALEGFSVTLGKAQQGLAKSQRAFLALGFTKAQIKGFSDADTALKAVTERIAGLSNQQQDAIISQLGLDGLKPLIEGGVTSMQRLREEAHKVGIVMDADLVRRGGELNDQFETLSKVIDVQLKSALVDLGPVLVKLLGFMVDLAKAGADVADVFRSIENKRTDHLKDLRDQFAERAASPVGLVTRGHDLQRVAEIDAELAKRAQRDKAPALPKATRALIDTSRTGGGSAPRDDTAQRTESVNAAVAAAARDLLQAQGKLTDEIDARAAIERKIADEELAQDLARLEKQKADLDADKGITAATRAGLKAKLDEAETSARKAAEAKVDLIARQQDWALEDRADETRKAIRDAEIANLEVASSLARTAEERRAIELQILKIKQDELTHELGKSLSRQEQTGAISAAEGQKRFEAGISGFSGQRQQVINSTRGPLDTFLDGLPKTIGEVNEAFQTLEAQGISSLIDGLAAAGAGAADLGDVFRRTLQQMAIDATRILLQNALANAAGSAGGGFGGQALSFLGSVLGGGGGLTGTLKGLAAANPLLFANGTDSAPGGLSIVGERGPELLNLPRGGQVIPNDILRNLARPGARSGGHSTTFAPVFHVTAAPGMSMADARRTGAQMGATAMREMSLARKRGY